MQRAARAPPRYKCARPPLPHAGTLRSATQRTSHDPSSPRNMNNAELYHENNTFQKRDAIDCLEEFGRKLRWRKIGDRIIDIGCGDGSVTVKVLKQYLPVNFEKLVGCDVSEKMITFANSHYKDGRTKFLILDLERKIPGHMKDSFDHVFSFYALHWIKDQELAFENIYDMLSDGGECLLTFLGHHSVFEVYRILAESNKWTSWLKGVDKFISPYYATQDPENEIRKLMLKVGFTNITVKCQEKLFIFDGLDAVKKAVQAVHPFHMPKEVFEDFITDYLDVVRDMKLMDEVNNNKPASVRANYKLLTVYGSKPQSSHIY